MSRYPRLSVQCPAAELTRGTLSLNKQDVRCGVAGLLRDAKGSPCCGEYTLCPIWQKEKERNWKLGKGKRAEKMLGADGWV